MLELYTCDMNDTLQAISTIVTLISVVPCVIVGKNIVQNGNELQRKMIKGKRLEQMAMMIMGKGILWKGDVEMGRAIEIESSI